MIHFVGSICERISKGPSFPKLTIIVKCTYMVAHLVWKLSWVDFEVCCSTLCLDLLGPMGKWQNWLSSWARWWNISDLSQLNLNIRPGGPPCIILPCFFRVLLNVRDGGGHGVGKEESREGGDSLIFAMLKYFCWNCPKFLVNIQFRSSIVIKDPNPIRFVEPTKTFWRGHSSKEGLSIDRGGRIRCAQIGKSKFKIAGAATVPHKVCG